MSLSPILGLGFIIAGFDKLAGLRPYRRLARHWSWRERDMQVLGAAELAGGALLMLPATRRFGGAVLIGASAVALANEVWHRDRALALPRAGLLVASVLATVGPRELPSRRAGGTIRAVAARGRAGKAVCRAS